MHLCPEVLIFHTKFSYHLSNAIGIVKVALLVFIIIAGFVVLGGGTRVQDPRANFHNSFDGTRSASAYGLTIALYRIIYSYGGYNNAFNVANEIKVGHIVYICLTYSCTLLMLLKNNVEPHSGPQKERLHRPDYRLRAVHAHKRLVVRRCVQVRPGKLGAYDGEPLVQ